MQNPSIYEADQERLMGGSCYWMMDTWLVDGNNESIFADDTSLFSSGSNAISLQDGVNNDLAIIAEWLKVIQLYIQNTHFMCFSTKKYVSPRSRFISTNWWESH